MRDITEIEDRMVAVRNLFVHVFRRLVQGVQHHSEVLGTGRISTSQLKALSAFHEDRAYSMSELSRNALVKMPSMTEMVDRLEQAGFLERVRSDADRRIVNVRLTDRGRRLHEKFIDRRRMELQDVFGGLSVDDRDKLVEALKTVSDILGKVARI